MNQAAFKSASDALRFAFNHSSQAYGKPTANGGLTVEIAAYEGGF